MTKIRLVAGTGLPPLPEPAKSPTGTIQRQILVVVLHLASQRARSFVSQREIQQILNRSGRDPIVGHLHSLRVEGFLKRPIRVSPTNADTYLLGNKLKSTTRVQWRHLSAALFRPNGLCDGLLGRPAFGTQLLGFNGMLVLSALRRAGHPLTVSELHGYLGFFIKAESTLRTQLARLAKNGLATQEGPRWQIAADWGQQLGEYESRSLAIDRSKRIGDRVSHDRRRFALSLHGSPLTAEQMNALKSAGCVYCRKTNEQCRQVHGKDLTIEHFPPESWLRIWGISDNVDLNWAICPPENSKFGRKIRSVSPPPLNKVKRISVSPHANLAKLALAKLEVAVQQFYRELLGGRRDSAARIAAEAVTIWLAVNKSKVRLITEPLRIPAGPSRRLQRRSGRNPSHYTRRRGS